MLVLSARLTKLADELDQDMDLEDFHDRRGDSASVAGLDGWLIKEEPYVPWPTYKGILSNLRELATSALECAADLPEPRKKNALGFAAKAFLHIRRGCGFGKPSKYDNSADVQEFERVCLAASIVLSRPTLRNALSTALEDFDPHYLEPGIREIFYR